MEHRRDRCARVQGVRLGSTRAGRRRSGLSRRSPCRRAGASQQPAGRAGGQRSANVGAAQGAQGKRRPPPQQRQTAAQQPREGKGHGSTPQARSRNRCTRRAAHAAPKARQPAGDGVLSLVGAARDRGSGRGLQPSDWAAAGAHPARCVAGPLQARNSVPVQHGRPRSAHTPGALTAHHQTQPPAGGQRRPTSQPANGLHRALQRQREQNPWLTRVRTRAWGTPCPDRAAIAQRRPRGPSLDARKTATSDQCSAAQTAPQAAASIAQQAVHGLAKQLTGHQAPQPGRLVHV